MCAVTALSDRPRLRLATLCALYLAQGIPYGFVFVTLKAWLGAAGLSVAAIGNVLALGGLPWAFKAFWGPVLDGMGPTQYGRRRPWIIVAQSGMVSTIAAMLLIPDLETSVVVLGWMVFVHNVFNSLQDVAVDALAVDLLPEAERGKANGLMYGSKYLGAAIGGAGLAMVASFGGLKAALAVQVVLLAVIMLLPLLLIEHEGDRRFPWDPASVRGRAEEVAGGWRRGLDTARSLLRAFSLRSTLVGGVLAWLIHIPLGVLSAVGAVFFIQHLGWSKEFYAGIEGGPALLAGLLASVAGGFLADRFGRRRTIAVAAIAVALLAIGFSFGESLWSYQPVVVGFLILDTALVGLVSVGLFALFMDISWPKVAATQFTTYMALLNLSTSTGSKLAGWVDAQGLAYSEIFLYAGLYQLVVVWLLWFIDPGQTRRELGTGA
jgi:MFS transporter, PAT family, beta-lactamase induction signal transducer AmpG